MDGVFDSLAATVTYDFAINPHSNVNGTISGLPSGQSGCRTLVSYKMSLKRAEAKEGTARKAGAVVRCLGERDGWNQMAMVHR